MTTEQKAAARPPSRSVSPVALAVLFAGLALSAGLTWVAHALVDGQERRLLKERANEVNLVLTQAITSVTNQLSTLARLASSNPPLFQREAAAYSAASPQPTAFAVLRPEGSSFVAVQAEGPGLAVGDTAPPAAAAAMTSALQHSALASTPVMYQGRSRLLGFALPATGGQVVYQVQELAPYPSRAGSGTAPFSDLRVVLFDSQRPDPAQVLLATAPLPFSGTVYYAPLMAGSTPWVLGVRAERPLVGDLAALVPWGVLAVGVVGAFVIFALVETISRRRDAAVALYEGEHRFAETLQRRLLPVLPGIPGLELASRYVAASDTQQVGGDWFDVFPLPGGRTAVVIGDVVGHDVEAAAAMAQVRSALRAYAWEGGGPASVLDRLAGLVDAFQVAALVTVIYGIPEPPGPDGGRVFRWTNAGHLPPLLRESDGAVVELRQGATTLLGAPRSGGSPEGQHRLPSGSSLLLYTDGLVEVQGEALDESIAKLAREFGRQPADAGAQELCEALLGVQLADQRNDDVAMVVVRVLAGTSVVTVQPEATGEEQPLELSAADGSPPPGPDRPG